MRTRVDKMGFPTSLHTWLISVLAEPLQDILTSQAARERGIYDTSEIQKLLRGDHRIEPWDALRLFYLAQFELWNTL